jgi:Zn-finger domain-containing protein
MNMGMTMECGHYLRQARICGVCGQEWNSHKAKVDYQYAVIFGTLQYATCPVCKQEASDKDDKAYQRRVDVWVRRHRHVVTYRKVGLDQIEHALHALEIALVELSTSWEYSFTIKEG